MRNLLTLLKGVLVASLLFGNAAQAEDIDIFGGTTEFNTALPSVIFVLDNTANWARANQQWPGGVMQGESQLRAIKTALGAQVGKLNVGIMPYIPQAGGGGGTRDYGYVRFNLQELTPGRLTQLNILLDQMYSNFNTPDERRDQANPYGWLPASVYAYLAGDNHPNSGLGTPNHLADSLGYTTPWTTFRSPLLAEDVCSDVYVIFIGNNTVGGIQSDSSSNSNMLKALYQELGETPPDALAGDSGGTPLPLQEYVITEVQEPDTIIPAVYGGDPVCTPEVVVPETVVPAGQLGVTTALYRNNQVSQCTIDEHAAGGLCDGVLNCSCGASGGSCSQGACTRIVSTTGYTIPGYVQPEQCTPGELITPEQIIPGEISVIATPTGQPNLTAGRPLNFDDWSKFLFSYGVPVSVTVDDASVTQRVRVRTYAIDVYNANRHPAPLYNADLTALWQSAAKEGGGRYFQASSESQILAAINSALGDILAVNTSFAAVSLPLSATNRAQVENQVYVGMFRPAPGKSPRWAGNLKRYQLALFNNEPRLADVNRRLAINTNTGFLRECVQSFWTEDSGTYWQNLNVDPPPFSNCGVAEGEGFKYGGDSNWSAWSDVPDGPFVEKGGVAQQIRDGVTAANRMIYTSNNTSLRALASSDATALGGNNVYDYFRGGLAGVGETMPDEGLRASVHGDIVHSRPLSVRYNAEDIAIFYGSNDGLFRAVDPATGVERWSLIAPEHFGKISRLYNDIPRVRFTGSDEAPGFSYARKDYFFDGSTGELIRYSQAGNVELAYIYPTMRRGGRMVYALDVTDPDAPELLWKHGCPSLNNDSGCTAGFSNIGQTWSVPVGGYVLGYVDNDDVPKPLVMFGGGFDDCLNEDVAAYPASCSSAKGKGVYILDAETGQTLRKLDTDAPVITDVATVDLNFDGFIDFAYVADVAGNLYRINLSAMAGENPANSLSGIEPADWTIVKIGSIADNTRRFFNSPAAAAIKGSVMVTLGSGDRERPLEINYPYASDVQNRFYALMDRPYLTFVASNPNSAIGEVSTVDLDGNSMLAVESGGGGTFNPSVYDGWYMDLPDRGEQVANAAAIAGGKVFFNTFQPGGVSDGICSRPLGVGKGYAVDLFSPTFTAGEQIDGGGMPIPPGIYTVKVPPGTPDCFGAGCNVPEIDCSDTEAGCRVVTVCIGCQGFEPIEVVPNAPPIRRRVYYSEDTDRGQ